jgi:hypothetical protein
MKAIPKYLTLLILLAILPCKTSFSQSSSGMVIKDLPLLKGSVKKKITHKSEKEKMKLLKMLPKEERLEFIMDIVEDGGDTSYYEFSLGGLYFMDLDFDGDLDLLYSGQSGTMMQTSTKIYYNNNNRLIYHSTLEDGVLDIIKEKNAFTIYTLFFPCCDSYTSIIKSYHFSTQEKANYIASISIVNQSRQAFSRMPEFNTGEFKTLISPSLISLSKDIKTGSGYFGKRDKEISNLLRKKIPFELIKIEGEVKVEILGEGVQNNEKYYLVITEILSDLAKNTNSLFEWSNGDQQKLVGWVKAKEID